MIYNNIFLIYLSNSISFSDIPKSNGAINLYINIIILIIIIYYNYYKLIIIIITYNNYYYI